MKLTILNISVIICGSILVLILIGTIIWRIYDYYVKKNKTSNLENLGFFDKKTINEIYQIQNNTQTEFLVNILVKNKFSDKKYSIFGQILITNNCIYLLSNMITNIKNHKLVIEKNGLFIDDTKRKKVSNWETFWLYDQKKWLDWKFKNTNYEILILVDESIDLIQITNNSDFKIVKPSELKQKLKNSNSKTLNLNNIKKIFINNNIFKNKKNNNGKTRNN
ncbi:hypothetical protein [Mesomycoplasma neurolyticum]|uniref:NERD domain-containing protein n=1 Tax=Mesomycoplasma neurolyticum TaxID=2120 RepID=A0A449A4X8_9BACT|nr:hypothetical protein [Mesomycoplasma neurolyticum]VEU59350.1 Uncharacterised protein [Mesomycoplasma neurolyticum]